MTLSRRHFVAATAAGAAASLAGCAASTTTKAAAAAPATARRTRIGVSTYSFWHFKGDRPDMLQIIDTAAEMGFDGVEILHQMMPTEDNDFCQQLKHRAFVNGVDLMGFSIHQGFVTPDPAERQKNIDHTLKCIELAYRMGIPTLRLNTGRWKTIPNFDEFMANKGKEPTPPGQSDEEAFKWVVDSINKCLPKAKECGVCMGLENHWGLGREASGVMRIYEAVNSPWLKCTLDTGNFLENMYPQMERMAPHAVLVQAKTYFGGGEWYTLDIDYNRVASILKKAGFKGYISLEFEGKEPPATGVPKSLELFRRALG